MVQKRPIISHDISPSSEQRRTELEKTLLDEPHPYDEKARFIGMTEPTITRSLRTLARAWAVLHPTATSEERQFLAAIVAAELAGR